MPNGEAHARAGHQKLGAETAADHNGMTTGAPKGHSSPKAAKREAAKAATGAQASLTDKENLHSMNAADGKAQSVIGAPVLRSLPASSPMHCLQAYAYRGWCCIIASAL